MKSGVDVRITKYFFRELKSLSRKYPSLESDMARLNLELISNPHTGTPLGGGVYKIRLAIKSKRKGKSGGARVISFLQTELLGVLQREDELIVVNLIAIYDKSEVASISKDEIMRLIAKMES